MGGKVVYSDDPCPSAKIGDVVPNAGVGQLSGKRRLGADRLDGLIGKVSGGAAHGDDPLYRLRREYRDLGC
ncbi:hypothetical protein ACDA63_06675 [Uliginosibacterium sp. sgz301328]|uniref:hypothetical protein n=1 Tax=Uliginosibacterium sp. sgz301328 TaxID=3243764 RepID=UPI00359E4052